MDQDELLKLREEAVAYTQKLALEGDASPVERMEVLLGLLRSGDASLELMRRVYETAQQLPEDSAKLDAMLDLIYEIDTQLAPKETHETGQDSQPSDESSAGKNHEQ